MTVKGPVGAAVWAASKPAVARDKAATARVRAEVMGEIVSCGGLRLKLRVTKVLRAAIMEAMGVDDKLLNEVVRRVLSVARPAKIILFGSAAAGTMNADSDLDLLIVEPEPINTRDRSVHIRRALGDVEYPVDLIVISSDRFTETKDLVGSIAYPANKYGRVLYEAA